MPRAAGTGPDSAGWLIALWAGFKSAVKTY
jgi:hypothetical protein